MHHSIHPPRWVWVNPAVWIQHTRSELADHDLPTLTLAVYSGYVSLSCSAAYRYSCLIKPYALIEKWGFIVVVPYMIVSPVSVQHHGGVAFKLWISKLYICACWRRTYDDKVTIECVQVYMQVYTSKSKTLLGNRCQNHQLGFFNTGTHAA